MNIALLFKIIKYSILKNYKAVFWEITTACNCKCDMCSLWKKKSKMISLEQAKKLVDLMDSQGVIFIQLTGGEPTLFKQLPELIKYINGKGIFMQLCTNGLNIDEDYAKKLKASGLKHVSISIDHTNEKIHDKIRRVKGAFKKALKAIEILNSQGFKVHSSTMISKMNFSKIEEIVKFANNKGMSFGTCYPYPNFNKEKNVSSVKVEQLIQALEKLSALKEGKKLRISNISEFFKESIKYAKKEKMNYSCMAGDRLFALKKNKFSRCWLIGKKKNDLTKEPIKCNKCNLTCFREGSIYMKMYEENKAKLIKEILKIA